MWDTLSVERTSLSFTIAVGPCQRYHSWIWVPCNSWSYFTVSDSKLPKPEGPVTSTYIPRNRAVQCYSQGSPLTHKAKVKVMLWPMVSQTICLGIKHPSRAYNQIFMTVRQLWVCWCGTLWQQGGSVVYSCCWPSTEQSFSGSKSHGTRDHILLSQIRDFPFHRHSQGYGGGIWPCLHTGS
jgi:hypothetical protein